MTKLRIETTINFILAFASAVFATVLIALCFLVTADEVNKAVNVPVGRAAGVVTIAAIVFIKLVSKGK